MLENGQSSQLYYIKDELTICGAVWELLHESVIYELLKESGIYQYNSIFCHKKREGINCVHSHFQVQCIFEED